MSTDIVTCGCEVWGCCSHLSCCQPEDDTSAEGGHDQENHRDHWVKPILRLPALWANGCPYYSNQSDDFCTSNKAGSWAPSPSPNWVTPHFVPPYSAWLQTWLFYSSCLPSGRSLLAFCYGGRFDQQSQCQSGGGLSHCLADGLILP